MYNGYNGSSVEKVWNAEKQCYNYLFTEKTPVQEEKTDKVFLFDGARCPGTVLQAVISREKFLGTRRTPPSYKFVSIEDKYPGLANNGKIAVLGDVYSVSEKTLKFLDLVYKVPQNHKRIVIPLDDGERAYVYLISFHKIPYREELIESGDWIEWKKNEKQRLILKKEQAAQEEKERIERMKEWNEKYSSSSTYWGRECYGEYYGDDDDETSKESSYQPETTTENYEERLSQLEEAFSLHEKHSIKYPNGIYPANKTDIEAVHIFDIPFEDIKAFLLEQNHKVADEKEGYVRVLCQKTYGNWFIVG